jgi:hypothetical protein
MYIRTALLAAALAGAAFSASAQTMKPGLWEISNKMNSPQMDQAMAEMQKQLAAMPPDQRKQMEAMMAQRGVQMVQPGAGGGMSVRMCMTKEMIERNEVPMHQSDCKVTSQQKSGNTTKMAFSCTNPPTTGQGEYSMSSPEAYSSKMTMRTVVAGKPETVSMDSAGRWVGADCGSVKPLTAPKK